ncbi:MAG: DNA-binding protein [bacterium]|nr:DNA-binding protein [bacterium]
MSADVVAVFGSSQTQPDEPDYVQAMRCGQLLAQAGFRVATGGYAGLMEAVSRGAAGAGGTVIAATAPDLFPMRSGANEWAHIESPQPTLSLRIGQLVDHSVATISLPGSIGTLTELMVAWNASHVETLGNRRPRPVITVGDRWIRLIGLIADEVNGMAELITHVATVDAAVAAVVANSR